MYHKEPPSGPVYDYRYGWCFFTAGVAFIMTKMAAVFSLSGYLNRFPSVDEMVTFGPMVNYVTEMGPLSFQVREMVPGAERKLREHQHLSTEYLVRHAANPHHHHLMHHPTARQQYDPILTHQDRPKYETECGPLLNKTPPDVCTTNKCLDFQATDLNSAPILPPPSGVLESNFTSGSSTFAGQTIPITIKNHASSTAPPLSLCSLPASKYGTLPAHNQSGAAAGATLHQGFLGVSEIGSSSSNSSSGYCAGKSKTLQHQRARKKCVKIETFQTPGDTGFADFSKRTNTIGYSGSAV